MNIIHVILCEYYVYVTGGVSNTYTNILIMHHINKYIQKYMYIYIYMAATAGSIQDTYVISSFTCQNSTYASLQQTPFGESWHGFPAGALCVSGSAQIHLDICILYMIYTCRYNMKLKTNKSTKRDSASKLELCEFGGLCTQSGLTLSHCDLETLKSWLQQGFLLFEAKIVYRFLRVFG